MARFGIFCAMKIHDPRTRASAAFFLALLIIWFRAPERLSLGYLWAEDANLFLLQAHQFGKQSIFLDYAGYLHFIPRLIAYAQFMLTPISVAPYVFALTCALLIASACAYISAAVPLVAVALLIGISPVISPQDGEVLLSIANLQWMLCPALLVLLWECLLRPPVRWIAPRVVATVTLTLTGPFGVLLAPAVVVVAVWRRKTLGRAQLVWLALYGVAVIAQAWVMHAHPATMYAPPAPVDWLHRAPKELFSDLLPGTVPVWTGVVLAVWLAVVIAGSEAALLSGFICVVGIVIWALAAHRVSGNSQVLIWYQGASRYLYVAMLMFLWASILSAATARNRTIAGAASLFAVMILLASAGHFEAQKWPKWTLQDTPTTWEITMPPNWHATIPR